MSIEWRMKIKKHRVIREKKQVLASFEGWRLTAQRQRQDVGSPQQPTARRVTETLLARSVDSKIKRCSIMATGAAMLTEVRET